MSKYWNLSAPITVHVEVTEACNEKCRHCYNFSRCDGYVPKTISMENLDKTINELVKNNVMHVIITGGEPLLALDRTIYLAEKSLKAGMTVSLNSNLVAANSQNMKKIKDSGIDHILTTLHSYKEDVHDYVANTKGSFKKVVNGIKEAQNARIRVTVNTILFSFNKDDIYETGKFVHGLGVKKFLANRTIPSPTNDQSLKEEFKVGVPEASKMFKDLKKLRDEFGMEVGTCRTVPQCFFDELDENDEFLARGCAAGKKHMMINVNGDAHACVHESKTYGNIHEIGLKNVWENMDPWRTDEYIPQDCKECHLFGICDGGCRFVALEHTGSMKGFDNLRRGATHLPEYKGGITPNHLDAAKTETFMVNPDFSYRDEDGFCIVRTRGARIDFIDDILCDLLIDSQKNQKPITLNDFGDEYVDQFAYYIKRDILVPFQ